jgi:hypothetical protein
MTPLVMAQNNTNTTIQTQHCPIPGTNPVRYNTSCYTFTPQTFDKLTGGFQKALNQTLPDEK